MPVPFHAEPASLEPVQELIDSLFSQRATVADSGEQDLADLLSHEHVIAVEMAAQILSQTPDRILTIARKASARCVVLEGPPAVLLDVAGIASETEVAP